MTELRLIDQYGNVICTILVPGSIDYIRPSELSDAIEGTIKGLQDCYSPPNSAPGVEKVTKNDNR